MLKSNLRILLAERKLSKTKVSGDTGISRTTLTALEKENSVGIQFSTINTLCMYLGIKPGDLFIYIPYNIKLKISTYEEEGRAEIEMEVEENNNKTTLRFGSKIILEKNEEYESENQYNLDIRTFLYSESTSGIRNIEENNRRVRQIYRELPTPFIVDMTNQICRDIEHAYESNLLYSEYEFYLYHCYEF